MRSNYLWYQFFRYGVVGPALQMFHSNIKVSGREQIPSDKPVIFVGNHQNALMDALHVVTSTQKFVHFLTRAEPFAMPVLRHFFRSLNMMPVYRVRDGFSTIRKNAETFTQCYHRLGQGDAVLVFAEANHDLRRRVRPLSKGFTRIAFGAEQEHNWQLDLQVQPVGLNYGTHQYSQAPVHIQFGPPIAIADFRGRYQEDERQAALALKDVAAKELKKVTMHVPDVEQYPFYHLMLDELEPDREKLIHASIANRRVAKLSDCVTKQRVGQADQLMSKRNNASKIDTNFKLSDFLLSPLYLFSLLNNAVPYQLVRWVTGNYIEDHVFDASAKFLLGLFGLPVWYILMGIGLGLAGTSWPAVVSYVLLSTASAPMFVRGRNLLFQAIGWYQEEKDEEPQLKEFRELRKSVLED